MNSFGSITGGLEPGLITDNDDDLAAPEDLFIASRSNFSSSLAIASPPLSLRVSLSKYAAIPTNSRSRR